MFTTHQEQQGFINVNSNFGIQDQILSRVRISFWSSVLPSKLAEVVA